MDIILLSPGSAKQPRYEESTGVGGLVTRMLDEISYTCY